MFFFFTLFLQKEVSYKVGVVLKMKKPVWLNLADFLEVFAEKKRIQNKQTLKKSKENV